MAAELLLLENWGQTSDVRLSRAQIKWRQEGRFSHGWLAYSLFFFLSPWVQIKPADGLRPGVGRIDCLVILAIAGRVLENKWRGSFFYVVVAFT